MQQDPATAQVRYEVRTISRPEIVAPTDQHTDCAVNTTPATSALNAITPERAMRIRGPEAWELRTGNG